MPFATSRRLRQHSLAHGQAQVPRDERRRSDVLVVVEVAAAAGLDVRNGIVVDDMLRTSDADISAVGDCAAHPNPFAGSALVRIESVQNATDQARCVAARLTGKLATYASPPWFWSDQGDLKLQIAGLTMGCDEVVTRGDMTGTSCAAFCFKEGRLLGVETVNRPADHMIARRLIGRHVPLTPGQAADEHFDLKAHLARATTPPG
jgi:3-phenylpropionate/trans-cinnamate dioxygenase ferredoxin reductase subunit